MLFFIHSLFFKSFKFGGLNLLLTVSVLAYMTTAFLIRFVYTSKLL